MNAGIRIRLVALGLAVGLMGASIIVVTLYSQKGSTDARARLGDLDLESFRIADHFKDKLRYANDKMRRYGSFEEPVAWEEFQTASRELKQWIDEQSSRLGSASEKDVLNKMKGAYELYIKRGEDLHEKILADQKPGASLAEFNGFFDGARKFMDLGQDLGRAHYSTRNEVLTHVSNTLGKMGFAILCLVVMLFLFVVALAGVVYRDLLAPLRVQLVETKAAADRQEKLASLGLLAAGVAHEIRNPLTAIRTALYLQQKNFPQGSAGKRDSELIEREILRLERIVNEFLRFARPSQPELVTVAAEQPLEEVRALLSAELTKSDIHLSCERSDAMRIRIDPAQMKQVLINLVRNAADSIGRGGTITLRAQGERGSLANGETDLVILEVADTGKGVPPEVEKRLFDPFFTTKESGTGLGLPIAARIVGLHGGILRYRTQMNSGSVFGVVLPRVQA